MSDVQSGAVRRVLARSLDTPHDQRRRHVNLHQVLADFERPGIRRPRTAYQFIRRIAKQHQLAIDGEMRLHSREDLARLGWGQIG